MIDTLERPPWLEAFLDKASKAIECMPNVLEWVVELDDEDNWHVQLYPAPTLVGSEISYPDAAIELASIIDLFERLDCATWHEETVELSGLVGGANLCLEVYLIAPDGVPARTRMMQDGRWEKLS